MIILKIKKQNNAKDLPLPKYETDGAAGLDLYANKNRIIPPGGQALIPTGISIQLPQDHEAQIRPRSSLALKYGVTVLNTPGTIDEDYRGEIGVILINHGGSPLAVHRGNRIAQMVINRIEKPQIIEVDHLNETQRGDGGFGSTGR